MGEIVTTLFLLSRTAMKLVSWKGLEEKIICFWNGKQTSRQFHSKNKLLVQNSLKFK